MGLSEPELQEGKKVRGRRETELGAEEERERPEHSLPALYPVSLTCKECPPPNSHTATAGSSSEEGRRAASNFLLLLIEMRNRRPSHPGELITLQVHPLPDLSLLGSPLSPKTCFPKKKNCLGLGGMMRLVLMGEEEAQEFFPSPG